ncbi:MAG TPA: cohesin domain-containing protein, partial [Pyrinomonadaceae bacterium]|nr:cohesin domain-containing protein [Pyrinomonadaceae bacterium]
PTGLTLSFTPIVFPNLDVQVKMKIESKDVSGASTLTPTFTERTLQGTARVQNNRTMMLASVSQDVQSNGRQGLPILSGLPVLGRLFTSPTRDNRQVDIVIAVTPRVLRAPAVTPRDEEMRPSGTLQAPTTGSLEAMLRETERDEQIAAARHLPKDAVIQVPDAAPAYEPAVKTDAGDQAKASEQQTAAKTALVNTPAQTTAAALQTQSTTPATDANRVTASMQTDAAMPQPKSAAITTGQNPPVLQTADVSTALKSLVSSPTNVSTTSLSAKQDTVLTPVTDVPVQSASNAAAANSAEPATSIIEVGLTPEKSELKVGEKRQLQLRVKSDAPLGLALVMLRFDPTVMKVNSISMGELFANAKTAPTLTQSIDNHGMILISLVPAAGSTVTADGTLFNIDVEALAAGDSTLKFDLSNVNVVASDGRPLLLKLEAIKLTVK